MSSGAVLRSAGPLGLRRHGVTGAALLLLTACGGRASKVSHSDDPEAGRGGTSSAGAAGAGGAGNGDAGAPDQGGSGGSGTAGAGDSGSGAGGTASACAPLAPRLIRLTDEQFVSSVEALAGEVLANQLRSDLNLGTSARGFPPLRVNAIDDNTFSSVDRIAQETATYAVDNIEAFSGCTAAGEIACVRAFLPDFAEIAFRRPLTDTDTADLTRAADEAEAISATPADVLWAGVYSVLHAPSFLYRTEFGEAGANAGELVLTPHEVADALAFFLRDAPPDSELLQAASDGRLSTAEDVRLQVERLLATPGVQANFIRAVGDYLVGDSLDTALINDPLFTETLRSSAAIELDHFVSDHLFSEPLGALLTSRGARINAELAPLYEITFPPSGVMPDADGFARVTLPDSRAGFPSRVGFFASLASVDRISIVRRGIKFSQMLCGVIPPLPEDPAIPHEPPQGLSEREKADYRMTETTCATCHQAFDPYGIALEGFDNLGRLRAADEVGAPIRASATLPEELGSVEVDGAVQLADTVAASGAFTNCVAQTFLAYALTQVRPELDATCEAEQLVERAGGDGDPSFSRLVSEIAISAFRMRQSAPARRLP
jgi:hypothetical protein